MAKMRAVQVTNAGGPFEIVERDVPLPKYGEVRIAVHACGICHSDSLTKLGHWPGVTYPRVPGHEIAGTIDAMGDEVDGWSVGQRVGVGWHGGSCGYCDPCRRGDFLSCQVALRIPGILYDGGYEEYMIAPAGALAHIPDALTFAEAAPLMCAGVTTFNSLRRSGARAGDVVAILGIGGLGHLGVQFAAKMGYHTVAIARGADKAALARKLGAHVYIDSRAQDVAAELLKLGGARVVLATVTSGKAMTAALGGLGIDGKLIVVGAASDPIDFEPRQLIGGRRTIMGWPSGTSIDSQDAMRFCALSGIRSMNEIFSLERTSEAYDRMMSGDARFRVVLTTKD